MKTYRIEADSTSKSYSASLRWGGESMVDSNSRCDIPLIDSKDDAIEIAKSQASATDHIVPFNYYVFEDDYNEDTDEQETTIIFTITSKCQD